MRAVQVVRLEGPDSVEVAEVEEPKAASGEVLIDVAVAGVTFPDVLLTRGEYQFRPDPPFIPGSEVAGMVREAPEGAHVTAGDRVAAFCAYGGFAEVVAATMEAVFPLPEKVSFAAGAALPMNYLTVEFALVRRGNLREGETVLIHGAAGGVGTAAVQLAKALGARVIAVCSSDEKAKVATAAGADDVVKADDFLNEVRGLTSGGGVDLIVDPVGGDRFTDSLRSLGPEGRLLVIGFTGREIPTVKVNRLLLNNTAVVGVGWGGYALGRPGYVQEQWSNLLPHLESGSIDPPLGNSYPLEKTGDALRELDERRATGKVTLEVR
jgi:NADPH2:quinone reductase